MTVRVWALLFVGAGFVWAEGCGGDTNSALFNGRGGNANAGAGGVDAGETGGAGGADSTVCKNSLDCVEAPGGRTVCDRAAGMCVECVADADCDAPTRCYAGHCRTTCTSDKDCTRQGLLCDTQGGHCVECVVDGDCALRTTCVAGSCESTSPPGRGGSAATGGRAGGPAGDGGATGRGGVSSGGTLNSGGSIITSGGADPGGNANAGGSPSAGGNTNAGGMLASGGVSGAGGVGAGGAPPASCTNKKKDNAETDVDCGGGTCPPCQSTQSCKVGADCASKSCSSGACAAPSCSDGFRNGTETSVDCGGGCLCRVNAPCTMPSDCASGACSVNSNGSTGTCKPALTCSNGTRDGTETGIDCGGPACNKCGATLGCNSNIDCASFVCEGKVCAQCDAMKCPVPLIPLSTACCIANAGCGMSIAGTPCL